MTYGATLGVGRALLATTAIAGLAALATPAKAGVLETQVFDNGVLVPGSLVSSTVGVIPATTVSDANFSSITFGAEGVPFLGNPDLSTITLAATASNAPTLPVTLKVEITQINNTGFPSGNLKVSDASNALIGSVTSVIQSTYLDPSNTAFGTGAGTLLDNHTPGAFPDTYSATYAVGPGLTTFSETQIYTLVFGGANASYGGAMTLQSVPSVPMPEPATFAVLGTGMLGLGLARRRRR